MLGNVVDGNSFNLLSNSNYSPKMVAILNFGIFAKNAKTQICFYLLNHAR